MLFAQGIVDAQADKMVMKTYKVLSSFTSSLWLCHVQSLCTRFYSLIVSVWSSHCQASNQVPCSKEEDVWVWQDLAVLTWSPSFFIWGMLSPLALLSPYHWPYHMAPVRKYMFCGAQANTWEDFCEWLKLPELFHGAWPKEHYKQLNVWVGDCRLVHKGVPCRGPRLHLAQFPFSVVWDRWCQPVRVIKWLERLRRYWWWCDLQFFEMIKNKIVSSIIVPENCAYVIVLLFYKLVRKVTELK